MDAKIKKIQINPATFDDAGEIKKLALDLFCGGGGACLGIMQAGFDVIGVDIALHSNYPAEFVQADVMQLPFHIADFDFVWASPPCQRYSFSSKFGNNDWERHPDLIPDVRKLVETHPFSVIENVPGAPIRPDVVLTGTSVGLGRLERRRHFELSFFMLYPPALRLERWKWEKGIAGTITTSMCASSHFYNRKKNGLKGRISNQEAKEIMGIDASIKMTNKEIGEAVPPAYAHFIAREALRQMN